MTKLMIFSVIYVIFNLVALGFMKADKTKAEKKQWRIPEKTLFLLAFLGGGVGILSGMSIFRHKTKTWYFVVGIPPLVALNFFCIYLLLPYLK